MIDKFIKDVCDMLDMTVPSVKFDTSSNAKMARCDSSGLTIFLKKCDQNSLDYLFSIAHELRHIWQLRSNRSFYFSSYKTQEQCTDFEQFHLQEAELDANAFAGVVMMKFFQIKPLFDDLPDSARPGIYNRMEIIMLSVKAP